MYYELSKSQKKIACKVMDKGLDNHYRQGLGHAEKIIQKWKIGKLNNKDAYMELSKKIEIIDKHIAGIYDGKGGSRWVEVMAYQLADGVISTDDLNEFDTEARDIIVHNSGIG
jgi:hypothetical protein